VLDIGPGAGMHGGHIVAQGTPADIMNNRTRSRANISPGNCRCDPRAPAAEPSPTIKVINCAAQQPENVSAEIPLGLFTA